MLLKNGFRPLSSRFLEKSLGKVLTIKKNIIKKSFRHFFCKYFILTDDLQNLAKKC